MLVVLCHPTDMAPEDSERRRWLDLLDPAGKDPSNIVRYLRDISQRRYVPFVIVTTWLDVQHTAAEAAALHSDAQRETLKQWGAAAVRALGIDPDEHEHVLYCYNTAAEQGSDGDGRAVLAYPAGTDFEPSYICRQVLTVLGLRAAGLPPNSPGEDWSDIMSAPNVWSFSDALGRPSGPAATGLHLEALGWLDDAHVQHTGIVDEGGLPIEAEIRVSLVPLYAPRELQGTRIAVIATPSGDHYLEYRPNTGWDAGLGRSTALLHHKAEVPVPVASLTPSSRVVIAEEPSPWGYTFHEVDANGNAVVAAWVEPKPKESKEDKEKEKENEKDKEKEDDKDAKDEPDAKHEQDTKNDKDAKDDPDAKADLDVPPKIGPEKPDPEFLKDSENLFKGIEATGLVTLAGWPGRADSDGAEVMVPVGRTFIRAEERPTVGARIVADPGDN